MNLRGDEVIGKLRKLYDEQLHNQYIYKIHIRKIKSRQMRREGHVANRREEK